MTCITASFPLSCYRHCLYIPRVFARRPLLLMDFFKWDKCFRDKQFVTLIMGIKNYVSTHPWTTAGVAKPAVTSSRAPNLHLTMCPRRDKQAPSPINLKYIFLRKFYGMSRLQFLFLTNYYSVLNPFFAFYYILIYKFQQDAHVTEFILSDNCSTCFGYYYHPSSGAQNNCNYSIW